jgi:short-subunit dehydrogenase
MHSLVHHRLEGHVALITGASSGIGEALAHNFAARGVKRVILVARREERLRELAQALANRYPSLTTRVIAQDLSQPGSAEALFQKVEEVSADHPVTVVVNNAGVGPYAPFVETELKDHRATLDLNVQSLMDLSHLFARALLRRGAPAHLINIASIAGYQPVPGYAVYAATKHFVRVFSRVLGHELRATPIRVLCVCPGGTRTEFLDRAGQLLKKEGEMFMMSAEEVAESISRAIESGQSLVIPGLLNRLICWFPRLIPESWGLHFAEWSMKRAVSRTAPKSL